MSQAERQLLTRFGSRVRQLRERRGLSQEKFAFEVGVHPTYLSGIERGQRNLALVNIGKIAKALRMPISSLTKGV